MRREREDVRDHHVRLDLAHERQRVPRRTHHRLVEVQRLRPGGEHLILGRRGELESLALHVLLPALPRLQRDAVATRGQGAGERDHRERVAGVAEGA